MLPLPKILEQKLPEILDLRGVACPRNAARSRLVLAGLPKGYRLTIYLDEGSPIENVPTSLVADGHIVEKRQKNGDFWVLTVVKGESRV
ncbi:MAG: sulfurtransferase TusA family protein [Fibrobacter sp.]|nr:sulfurtransferase TusA family protein [Fibrobacter sp.]